MSNVSIPNVLVLDADQRSALAVTRSLGSKACVKVFTADTGRRSLAGSSSFSYNYLRCPSRDGDPQIFLDWIKDAIDTYEFDTVFPMTEITSQLLLMNKSYLGNCKIPFPEYDAVSSLADKGRLMESAHKAGVPVPDYSLFNKAAEVDSRQYDTFPLAIKPCLSRIWTGDRWVRTSVKIVYNRAEMESVLATTEFLQDFPFMVQSYIPGHGAGLFALYDRGKPVAYFSHRRIREKPPLGGVSVLCESVAVDPKLRDYAEALLTSVSWHGVAMVEFRISDEGEPYLMEVNTRFWGSLQLAIDAGIDFPYLLWKITAGEKVTKDEIDYRVGQRLRWLLGDLDSLYLCCKSREMRAAHKLRRMREFCTPAFNSCRHEVNRWGDLGPAWYELRHYLLDLLR